MHLGSSQGGVQLFGADHSTRPKDHRLCPCLLCPCGCILLFSLHHIVDLLDQASVFHPYGSIACAAHAVVLAAAFCGEDGAQDQVVAAIRKAVDLADNSAAHAQAVSSACLQRMGSGMFFGGGVSVLLQFASRIPWWGGGAGASFARHSDGCFRGWCTPYRFLK